MSSETITRMITTLPSVQKVYSQIEIWLQTSMWPDQLKEISRLFWRIVNHLMMEFLSEEQPCNQELISMTKMET